MIIRTLSVFLSCQEHIFRVNEIIPRFIVHFMLDTQVVTSTVYKGNSSSECTYI